MRETGRNRHNTTQRNILCDECSYLQCGIGGVGEEANKASRDLMTDDEFKDSDQHLGDAPSLNGTGEQFNHR